eukprot:1256052-Rhodomonas_salina.1
MPAGDALEAQNGDLLAVLLSELREELARYAAAVGALEQRGALQLVLVVRELPVDAAAEVPAIHCLQEARGAALEHDLHHDAALAAREVHPVVVRHHRHRRRHVPEHPHEARPRHVVAHQVPAVHTLQPARRPVQSQRTCVDPPPVPVHVAPVQTLP